MELPLVSCFRHARNGRPIVQNLLCKTVQKNGWFCEVAGEILAKDVFLSCFFGQKDAVMGFLATSNRSLMVLHGKFRSSMIECAGGCDCVTFFGTF